MARLVLVSSLDREQAGPRVTVTLVCERLGGRRGDVFTLPVTIHVTDVNDNAPVFVSGPQVLNVTEDTPLGTVLTEVSGACLYECHLYLVIVGCCPGQ